MDLPSDIVSKVESDGHHESNPDAADAASDLGCSAARMFLREPIGPRSQRPSKLRRQRRTIACGGDHAELAEVGYQPIHGLVL